MPSKVQPCEYCRGLCVSRMCVCVCVCVCGGASGSFALRLSLHTFYLFPIHVARPPKQALSFYAKHSELGEFGLFQ